MSNQIIVEHHMCIKCGHSVDKHYDGALEEHSKVPKSGCVARPMQSAGTKFVCDCDGYEEPE